MRGIYKLGVVLDLIFPSCSNLKVATEIIKINRSLSAGNLALPASVQPIAWRQHAACQFVDMKTQIQSHAVTSHF